MCVRVEGRVELPPQVVWSSWDWERKGGEREKGRRGRDRVKGRGGERERRGGGRREREKGMER